MPRSVPFYTGIITAPVGVVLDIIDWSDNIERRSQALIKRLRMDDIQVSALVEQQFALALRSMDPGFTVSAEPNPNAEARCEFDIEHGLSNQFGMADNWRPYVTINATLIRNSDEQILWSNEASVSSRDERIVDMDRPFYRPGRLRRAYLQAVRFTIQDLLREFI